MAKLLKQSTATTVALGPFVDDADGKTAETALTISQSDVLLWKEGGTSLAAKNESTACTHRSIGYYTCPLDATDTNTLGQLTVAVHESGALPVRHDFLVVKDHVYDTFCGSDYLQVDVKQIASTTAAATKLAASAGQIYTGTTHSSGGTSTEFSTSDITEATTDHFKGRIVIFTDGALAGQATAITGYVLTAGRGTFTVNTLTEAVPNSTGFVIV
jgi:hypothetical protein